MGFSLKRSAGKIVGHRIANLAGKVVNSKTVAYVMPIASIYTKAGRAELGKSPWGGIGKGVATVYGGPQGGAIASTLIDYGTAAVTPKDRSGPGASTEGAFVSPTPDAPMGAGLPSWALPAALAAGVLVVVLLMRRK